MPEIKNLRDMRANSTFSVKSKGATKAEIVIYQPIGQDMWGEALSAKQFSDALKALDPAVNDLSIRINSPGGDVFDGIAIFNRIKQFKGKKTVYIDGLAASIASIIALAGDEIIMGDGALYMIHLPWTFAMGNRNDLANIEARLIDIEEQMLSIYQRKTRMDRNEIRAMLEAETWLSAQDALDYKFVDKITEETQAIAASAMGAKWLMKKPQNYHSETKVIDSAKTELKKKIEEKLARK